MAHSVRRAGSAQPGPASAGPEAGEKPNRAPTAFEQRLYEVLKCVPAGKVTTYGAMAQVLGSSPRACGGALRRNPFAPVVPCHRVVASDMQLGGFSGSWGPEAPSVKRKRQMLEAEGVMFTSDGLKVASKQYLLSPEELASVAATVLHSSGSSGKQSRSKRARE